MKTKNYKGVMYVHGSTFHSDDALCAAMGKILGYEIKRTLDKDIVKNCEMNDLVCDFGRIYDGVRFFDHHQPDCPVAQQVGLNSRFPFAKVAGAGLFWAAYAKNIIRAIDPNVPEECIPEIIDLIDNSIIAPSDKIDTGDGELPFGVCTVSFMVTTMNPTVQDNAAMDAAFFKCVDEMIEPFLRAAILKTLSKIYGRKMVESAPVVENTVVVLDTYVTWRAAVIKTPKFDSCLYVVYPSLRGGWNGQVIPVSSSANVARKDFPIEWAGLVDKEFADAAGIEWHEGENYFCHVARFLIAAPTKEMAIKLCMIAAHK